MVSDNWKDDTTTDYANFLDKMIKEDANVVPCLGMW